MKKDGLCKKYSTHGEMRYPFNIFIGKHEGKRQLGRPRRGRERNIKIIFKDWDMRVWTGFIWLRIGTSGGAFQTR
jgi:hypothetical protein